MCKMKIGLYIFALFPIFIPAAYAIDEPAAGENGKTAEFVMHGITFPLGDNIEEIKKLLGAPVSHTETEIENRHVPGQIDHVHTLKYDGLEVSVYRASEDPPRDLIGRLVITGKHYPVKWGLNIGVISEKVTSVLGNPDKVKDGEYEYIHEECAGGACSATFHFQKGILEKIEWNWGID